MYYVDTNNGNRILSDLAKAFPHICFPNPISSQSQLPDGIFFADVKPAECDTLTHKQVVPQNATLIDGNWFVCMECSPLTPQDVINNELRNKAIEDAKKYQALETLEVTVNGLTFQANSLSLNSMLRYIAVFDVQDTVNWKLADDSIQLVTIQTLKDVVKEALVFKQNLETSNA